MPVSVARPGAPIRPRRLGDSRMIALQDGQHRRVRRAFRQLGFGLDQRRHALEDIHHLRVHRMLDPQRAVLVEGGDALGRRHEVRAALRDGRLHELDHGLLGAPSFHDGSGSVGACARAYAPRASSPPSARTRTQLRKFRSGFIGSLPWRLAQVECANSGSDVVRDLGRRACALSTVAQCDGMASSRLASPGSHAHQRDVPRTAWRMARWSCTKRSRYVQRHVGQPSRFLNWAIRKSRSVSWTNDHSVIDRPCCPMHCTSTIIQCSDEQPTTPGIRARTGPTPQLRACRRSVARDAAELQPRHSRTGNPTRCAIVRTFEPRRQPNPRGGRPADSCPPAAGRRRGPTRRAGRLPPTAIGTRCHRRGPLCVGPERDRDSGPDGQGIPAASSSRSSRATGETSARGCSTPRLSSPWWNSRSCQRIRASRLSHCLPILDASMPELGTHWPVGRV